MDADRGRWPELTLANWFRERPLDDVPTFLQRTYEAAPDLAGWDRDELEVVNTPLPVRRPGA